MHTISVANPQYKALSGFLRTDGTIILKQIRGSCVSIVTRLRVGRLEFLSRARGGGGTSLHHHVRTDSGVQSISCPMGAGGYFPRGKAARS
jgi:hypothetical protein